MTNVIRFQGRCPAVAFRRGPHYWLQFLPEQAQILRRDARDAKGFGRSALAHGNAVTQNTGAMDDAHEKDVDEVCLVMSQQDS